MINLDRTKKLITYHKNLYLHFPEAGNNLTLQISQFGAVNNYIDFTINGTYSDNVNGVAVTRTLSVTGHVKRDF